MRASFLFGLLVVVACGQSDPQEGILQPLDTEPIEGIDFDPNAIVDSTASFTDPYALSRAEDIQQFLENTPYKTQSFLATYQSNGVRPADAIARAAEIYEINPLVFLVRAQMEEGLISEVEYPLPARRVEYVFDCGCSGPACDPMLAGFDKQVDCLARALRMHMAQACGAAHQTAGGWAAGKASPTLDGFKVTPTNEATAVLYQFEPFVGAKEHRHNWLFWNLWQKYGEAAGYSGSFGQGMVGDACCGDSQCTFDRGVCAVNYPSGMCTAKCDKATPCAADVDRPTFCADLTGNGDTYCLRSCTGDIDCRKGYTCQGKTAVETGAPKKGCLP